MKFQGKVLFENPDSNDHYGSHLMNSGSAIFGTILNTTLLNYTLLVSLLHPTGASSPSKKTFLGNLDMYNIIFNHICSFLV